MIGALVLTAAWVCVMPATASAAEHAAPGAQHAGMSMAPVTGDLSLAMTAATDACVDAPQAPAPCPAMTDSAHDVALAAHAAPDVVRAAATEVYRSPRTAPTIRALPGTREAGPPDLIDLGISRT